METRICKECGKELPLEQFELEHTKKGDFRRNVCRKCRAIYRKNRRKQHPEIHLSQALRRQKRQGDWLLSLKTPCIICGEKESVCIDFHHTNPSEKEFTIGKHRSRSKEWLLNEISKCVCLCANCHRKIHAGILNLQDYLTENHPSEQREGV